MLQSFFVERFRLFNCLKIEQLNRVNLIVGKNNSGKSALLEAIELFVSEASSKVLTDFLIARQETWNNQALNSSERVEGNPLRHLFYGHRLPNVGEQGIRVGTLNAESESLHFHIVAFRIESSEEGVLRRIAINPTLPFEDLSNVDSDIEIALVVENNERIRRILRLDQDIEREGERSRRLTELANNQARYSVQVVPTRNMTEVKVASLWDQISLTDLEEEVISGLKIIEPRITGVGFVEGTGRSLRNNRIPLVKIDGQSEPLPLKSMGDGMTRLFHIVIALVNAQNGILLVDEFENGIHWSVQSQMWKTVFRLAEKLNVQVFATTHSQDCVEGFKTVWKEEENTGAFFRMNIQQDGESRITSYTSETLSDAMEMDVEVR